MPGERVRAPGSRGPAPFLPENSDPRDGELRRLTMEAAMPPPKWLWNLLIRLSSNNRAQDLLLRNLDWTLNLMGMGPGGFQISSGEGILLSKLRELQARSPLPLCIFDVGAHHGELLGELIQPLTESSTPFAVHAFEPDPKSYQTLRDAFKERKSILLNNFALGARDGQAQLFADAPGSNLASLSRRRLDHFGVNFDHVETIEVRTLDEYCSQQRVEAIDLLKLDVEGHELEVMQGGMRMFGEQRIRMLSFEFGGCNIDSRTYFQDFWYFINNNRMGRIHRMTPTGHLVPILAYTELYEQFRPTNYLVLQSQA
jgi:FkbM family methyltransferase